MTQADAPKCAIPHRVAFDSRGIGWRWFAARDQDGVVTDEMFSMVPVSSDNDPMHEPLTWFDREREHEPWPERLHRAAAAAWGAMAQLYESAVTIERLFGDMPPDEASRKQAVRIAARVLRADMGVDR